MVNVAVLGYGGHGLDIAYIASSVGHTVAARDDAWDGVAPTDRLDGFDGYLLGVNDPATRERMDTNRLDPVDVIHPTAVTEPGLVCCGGAVVGALTVLGPQVVLGRHVHLNAHVFATRCQIGAYTTVGPGATICGDVSVGMRCLIGAGAVVSNLVTLDDDVIIGAGAVVPPHSHLAAGTYVGVPARCCG